MEFKLDTTIFEDNTIKQELFTVENDLPTKISSWIINTREESIRKALIDLGWTPPGEKPPNKTLNLT